VSLERHLVALANLGLLEVGREEDTRVYRVSPLVKEVFDAPDSERWHAVAAAYWWKAANRGDSWHVPSVLQAWKHALQAKHQALADEAASVIHPWLDRLGHFAESGEMGQQHVTAFPNSIVGLLWAGSAQSRAGQPRKGLHLLQRSIELAKSLPGEHPYLSQAQDLLARVLSILGEHAEARKQLEYLVAAEEQSHSEGSGKLADYLYELANVLRFQGDLPAARSLFERALFIYKKVLGTEKHPYVAASLYALGSVLEVQGDLPAARSLLERSIDIYKQIFGTDEHPDIAACLHELARVLRSQGKLPAARSLLERSIDISKKVFGTEEHPNIAHSLCALAPVLQAQGDLPAARFLLERSIDINRKVFGTEEHPDIADSYVNLAGCLLALNLLDESEAAFRKALTIFERVHRTRDHSLIADAEVRLAFL
jgi:tetratricopeptide (TPR) repeat protein